MIILIVGTGALVPMLIRVEKPAGAVVQLGERLHGMQEVVSSSLIGSIVSLVNINEHVDKIE